jgi:hypothetical protein
MWICSQTGDILGVGLGSKATVLASDFYVLGVPTSKTAERTKDYVNEMKALSTQPSASFPGKWHIQADRDDSLARSAG